MSSSAAASSQPNQFTRDQVGALVLVVGGLVGIGLFEGASGAVWPDVIKSFDVSKGAFGLAAGIGLTIAFPFLVYGGRLTTKFDKRSLLVAAAACLVLAALGLTCGFGLPALALLMMIRGIGICIVDLSTNALAMEVENETQRHLMNPIHAGYSGGAVVGALIAWVVFQFGGSFRAVFLVLAILLSVYALIGLRERFTRAMRRQRTEVAGSSMAAFELFKRPDIRIFAAICCVSFCGEVLIAQWIGIYLRDEQGFSASIAVWAVVLLSGAMFVGRLVNTPIASRLGPRKALMAQGALLTAGGALIVLGGSAAVAVIGCGVAGIGLSGMGPTALSLAGRALPESPGAASGAALTGGYLGVMLIPYFAGAVASIASVRVVLSVEVLFGVLVVIAAVMLNRWVDARPATMAA